MHHPHRQEIFEGGQVIWLAWNTCAWGAVNWYLTTHASRNTLALNAVAIPGPRSQMRYMRKNPKKIPRTPMNRFDPRHHTHLYEFNGKKFKAKSKDQILRKAGLNVYDSINRAKVKILKNIVDI